MDLSRRDFITAIGGLAATAAIAFAAFSLSAEEARAPETKPSSKGVRYRGIFVNDEDWGLRPWAVRHFGKDEQIGVRAYERIFRRMKECGLNLIWPAMHKGGYEFSSRSENFALADRYGITVGTSHCEPMLRNNCYIPKRDRHLWSWTQHRDFVEGYWQEGVRRGAGHNVMFTLGMRGIHDVGMRDGGDIADKVGILEDVFSAQKSMLPEGASTMFCPYKEVLPLYNAGLKVPDDATVMWVNDNFGYIRRLASPERVPTRQGVYWHISYLGRPHGYVHLCTTPPAFMWYELVAKCWENGVRDTWVVNAGDVFQAEILMDAFGRFAGEPEAWGPDAQSRFLEEWVKERIFNAEMPMGAEAEGLCRRIRNHLAEYYTLGFNRRPEHMCVQWATNLPDVVKTSLLKRYHALLAEDIAIEEVCSTRSTCSTRLKSADEYFRLVGFQTRFLAYAGIIHLEGKSKEYARSVIDPLYERWDSLDGGEWAGFWSDTIDDCTINAAKHNRWSSQMQWPWNEPPDPAKKDRRGRSRNDYAATAYRADERIEWRDAADCENASAGALYGAWVRVEGLGTSGRAMALLPVKPDVGAGAKMAYRIAASNGDRLVLQFLPDFSLWPGLGLSVDVRVNGGAAVKVDVPGNDAGLGEDDKVRNAAVQDNFIRAFVEGAVLSSGENIVEVIAREPGVVVDKIGLARQRKKQIRR